MAVCIPVEALILEMKWRFLIQDVYNTMQFQSSYNSCYYRLRFDSQHLGLAGKPRASLGDLSPCHVWGGTRSPSI